MRAVQRGDNTRGATASRATACAIVFWDRIGPTLKATPSHHSTESAQWEAHGPYVPSIELPLSPLQASRAFYLARRSTR
eukprot:6173792-Pleurochrysis_carterae.AAC.1